MLAPAHNEARTVSESVRSLLTLRYPNLEVVLINDGSADATLEVLRRDFDLVPIHAAPLRRRLDAAEVRGVYRSRRTPALVVVDKCNGGKADALNVGLDAAANISEQDAQLSAVVGVHSQHVRARPVAVLLCGRRAQGDARSVYLKRREQGQQSALDVRRNGARPGVEQHLDD